MPLTRYISEEEVTGKDGARGVVAVPQLTLTSITST